MATSERPCSPWTENGGIERLPGAGGTTTLAIVGGGAWVTLLLDALARAPVPGVLATRLNATAPERLAVIAAHNDVRVRALRPGWSVTAAPSFAAAVDGADIVILLLRVGGAAARAHDEQFPTAFGLAGDEGLGAGGMGNAWRTVPVIRAMADDLRDLAPDAIVLNLVAPLGITTRTLLAGGRRAVGLCELPLVTRTRLLDLVPDLAPTDLAYAGLNHLGWFWPVDEGAARRLDAAPPEAVDRDLYRGFGAIPLPYVTKMLRPPASRSRPPRAALLRALADGAVAAFARTPGADVPALTGRSTPWFDQMVVPVATSLSAGGPIDSFLNIANATSSGTPLVASVPADVVVELEAELRGTGEVTPRAPVAEPPPPVAEFLAAAGEAEDLVYRAAVERDRSLLARALRASPFDVEERAIGPLVAAACAQVGTP